jgi:hypothetical protein
VEYTWRSDPGCESHRSASPTCWLILRVFNERVAIYFQYREGQFDSVLPWRQVQQQLTAEIKALCKKVSVHGSILWTLFSPNVWQKYCHHNIGPGLPDGIFSNQKP